MHVTLVHVNVVAGHSEDFLAATRANHEASVQEAGNLRFDVLRSPDDENYFLLYEAYRSAEDAAAHKETGHYKRWRDTVAGWMAKPRKGIAFEGLLPAVDDA